MIKGEEYKEQAEPSDYDTGVTLREGDEKEGWLGRKRLGEWYRTLYFIQYEATLVLGCSQPMTEHTKTTGPSPLIPEVKTLATLAQECHTIVHK